MDLVVWFASNMNEERRLVSVTALKAFRKELPNTSRSSVYKDSVKSLRALLPQGYALSSKQEKSAKSSAKSNVAVQVDKALTGRVYSLPVSSASKVTEACLSTLGVCPLTGVILKSISVDG
jgi:hypothetical protein